MKMVDLNRICSLLNNYTSVNICIDTEFHEAFEVFAGGPGEGEMSTANSVLLPFLKYVYNSMQTSVICYICHALSFGIGL